MDMNEVIKVIEKYVHEISPIISKMCDECQENGINIFASNIILMAALSIKCCHVLSLSTDLSYEKVLEIYRKTMDDLKFKFRPEIRH